MPNPENCSLEELDAAMNCSHAAKVYSRLLAIRELFHEVPFETVLKIHLISERTLQRWIADFNAFGIDGLLDQRRTGRPRKLVGKERIEQLVELIKKPELAGRVHCQVERTRG